MKNAGNLTLCLGLLSALRGCANVDGVNTYHLSGRLVSAQDGMPVVGATIVGAVFLDHDPPAEVWKRESSITDGSGAFDVPARRLWGGLYPLFLIPHSRTPGTLDKVAVYIGVGGKWQKHIITLRTSQQSKVADNDRWIDLGRITHDPNGPTVTTRPAGS